MNPKQKKNKKAYIQIDFTFAVFLFFLFFLAIYPFFLDDFNSYDFSFNS